MNKLPVGLLIGESSSVKKGIESVGVSFQYAGAVGKVDNFQVGVYASLCNYTSATIVHEKLFLSESWTDDHRICERAGILKYHREFRTKPELALEMIDECVENGVCFYWIGGDGLYGHSGELTRVLDDRGLYYVLDVHRDEIVYLEEPPIAVPEPVGNRGRKPNDPKTNRIPFRLDSYKDSLLDQDREKVMIRKTAKGWPKLMVHTSREWF